MKKDDEPIEVMELYPVISRGRNLQLDGLRAIAFLSVFIHHSLHVPLLWFGVDLFFVLSGFLITQILLRDTSPHNLFVTFYYKRFLRIFPPYYLVLLVVFFLFSSDWQRYWYWYVFYINNFQQVFGIAGHPGLIPMWSLAIEEQFYLLWPLLIFLLGRSGLWKLSLFLLFLAPIFRGLAGVLCKQHWAAYMLLPSRVDLLASGALLAMLLEKSKTDFVRFANKGPIFSVVAAGIFGLLTVSFSTFRTGANSVIFNVLGYSLINIFMIGIVAYLVPSRNSLIAKLLRNTIFVYLGTVSYMMYLVHQFVLDLIMKLGYGRGLTSVITLAVVIAVASFSWYFFESPISRLINRKNKKTIANTEVERGCI